MVDTSLQDAEMSQVNPEMAFSHRVDIFWKKSYRKIVSFKKVTAFLQKLKSVQKKLNDFEDVRPPSLKIEVICW